MTTIRGVYVGRALDVILEHGYPDEARYDLWGDLSLFAQNNFDEYLTYALRYHADGVIPEYIRYDIVVRTDDFNRPATYAAADPPEIFAHFRVGDVTFRAHAHSFSFRDVTFRAHAYSFSFRFVMPTTDLFHSPYELKRFLDGIKANFSMHITDWNSRADSHLRLGTIAGLGFCADLGFGADFDTLGTRDNARARKLLLSQCTESQVREYEKHRRITVYGGITGNKYRIRHAYQINIDVMDRDRVMYKLCTVADPVLNEDIPIEDNMLAQKTMIELNEHEFLQIAIRWEK